MRLEEGDELKNLPFRKIGREERELGPHAPFGLGSTLEAVEEV